MEDVPSESFGHPQRSFKLENLINCKQNSTSKSYFPSLIWIKIYVWRTNWEKSLCKLYLSHKGSKKKKPDIILKKLKASKRYKYTTIYIR